jgi:hypothetical protein
MNKEYIRINNQPFSILSLLRFVTILALIISCFIVFTWNWLNAAMDWDLRLNYWHCFLVLDVLGVFLILLVFIPQQGSGWNDQKVDAYIDEQVGPGYWDHNDPYDDY